MVIDSLKSFFKNIVKQRDSEPPLGNQQVIEQAFDSLDILMSDVVELEFKDPRDFGITNPKSTTFTRFNAGEFETPESRTVKGIVTRVWKEPKPVNEWFIEVATHVKVANGNTLKERKLLLMASELEWIRKIV